MLPTGGLHAATRSATFSVGGNPSYSASTVAAAVSDLRIHASVESNCTRSVSRLVTSDRVLDFQLRVDTSFPELIHQSAIRTPTTMTTNSPNRRRQF